MKTREDWLNHLAELMSPWFDNLDCPLPRIRIAIGFPSTGRRGRRIGECWDGRASEDGTFEILIRPDQADPLEVAAILAHELVHAAVGLEAGHKAPFRSVALAIGLQGPMRSTTPGPGFIEAVRPMLEEVGPLPHARLGIGASTGPKKQTTRMLKAECRDCGYTVRVARKWLEEVGAPHCPAHGEMTAEIPEDEEGEGEAE
jgi:hypothetical protein